MLYHVHCALKVPYLLDQTPRLLIAQFCAASIRERRLLNSVFSVKFFVIVRALRKASFIRRITMQLDQPLLCYEAVYLHGTSNPFPRFLPLISHDDRPPCLKKCRGPIHSTSDSSPRFVHVHMCFSNISRGQYSRAATISFSTSRGAATIRERRLIESGV